MAELIMDATWYRQLVDAMSDAIHVVDRELKILIVNHSFQAWLGQLGLPQDIVGRSVREAFPFLSPHIVEEYGEVFRTGKAITTDEENTLLGETIHTQTHKIPIAEDGEATRVMTIIRDVTPFRQAEEELRWLAAEKSALAHTVLTAQERERGRLARDLHDGVGQIVAVMKMEADYLASHADDSEEVSRVASRLTERADETLATIRSLSYGLRPPVLDDLGIGCALLTLVNDIAEHAVLDCVADIDEDGPSLPDAVSTGLYRMAQEALSNVLQHAVARNCRVSLRYHPEQILLEVEDDGRGINETEVHTKASGLSNLRERATLLGGRVTITGGSDGTLVSVTVPFEP